MDDLIKTARDLADEPNGLLDSDRTLLRAMADEIELLRLNADGLGATHQRKLKRELAEAQEKIAELERHKAVLAEDAIMNLGDAEFALNDLRVECKILRRDLVRTVWAAVDYEDFPWELYQAIWGIAHYDSEEGTRQEAERQMKNAIEDLRIAKRVTEENNE